MCVKRIQTAVIVGLLLLVLILPQLALANSAYSIILSPSSGRCGDLIEATAAFEAPGTYRICWDAAKPENRIATFTASTAGNRTIEFYVPETTKGTYNVSLTSEAYDKLATAEFTVFPAVSIDPTEGPVGTEVTFNGYGFKAAQDIRVSFEDTVKTGTANTVGSWNITHTIPPTPGGGYTFKVEFEEGVVWYDLVGKYFKVTPEITVSSSSGTVGRTIEIKGTGFASEEKGIEVTFRRQSTDVEVVVKESIPADVNGSWTAVIVVPPLQGGSYTIDASGELTRARDVPDIEDFSVGAGILVEPGLAYVGDTINVAGGGFRSGETGIKVTFDGTVEATGITAEIDGTWESSFVLPASTYGSHTVSASGDITKPAVTTTLDTKAKIELNPVEGAPGDSVTLTGSGFHGNQELTVTFAGTNTSRDVLTQTNGNVVATFPVPASTAGKQTVMATDEGGATASANFTVKEKVLPSPLPMLPQDGSKVRSGEITFRWGGITGGNDITYILEISDTAGFATVSRSESDIGELSYALPEDEALPKGTYYWRVKAVDEFENESDWSSPSSFTVSPIPTWVWVVVGVAVLVVLMVVAYRGTKFKVTE